MTTNGSELGVLEGLTETARRCDFISVACAYRTPEVGHKLAALAYEEVAVDDRGITYRRQGMADHA